VKINSSDRYLRLALRALETSIVPDLHSDASKGIAEIIRTVLLELLKREGLASAELQACIDDGLDIEAELRSVLGESSESTSEPLGPPAESCFETLRARHASLTGRLTVLCGRLAARRRLPDSLELDDDAGANLLRRVAEWEMSYYVRQAAVSPITAPDAETKKQPLTADYLQQFLNEQRGEGQPQLFVEAFQPLLGGYGKQTYVCRLRQAGSSAESDLVVRKTDPLDHMKFGFSTLEQEFYLLQSLAKTDFPSPRPTYLASNRAGVDGSFFTMPRIPGKVAGTFLGGVTEGHSVDVYLQLAELMARLHRMPIETFSDYIHAHGDANVLQANIGDCYRLNLQAWARYTADNEFLPSPYLSWLFDWLDHHVPRDTRRPVLVHGDFNVHNILADNGKVTGVLDWECAGFGAPEQDLAYVRPHISKHIDWDRFIGHYRACGGPTLNADAMQFCLIYSAIRVNLGGNRLTFNLQRGANWDIRYAMVDLGFSRAFMQMGLGA
jgi:aminoglycoside phosphotransferase (APT) family kinase protein